jgi:hypothetical protein
LPEAVRNSLDAWVGFIAGAVERNDYLDKIACTGFTNIKIVTQKPYARDISPQLKGKIISIQVEPHKSR